MKTGRSSSTYFLRDIKGTTHYKVTLAPKVEHNDQGQIKVHIESRADRDWAGCNTTGKGNILGYTIATHQQNTIHNCTFTG
eukprot:2336859-Amphidinium_carterae.5